MDDELVSIAMTTYNGEKFLGEQLDSIYNQKYDNLEVIVTDDCSTDQTVEILKEYSKEYGLKFSVNDRNIGFVKNFEKTISLCKGKYIGLADQDDVWLPEKIEILVRNIGLCSLICSDAYLIDQNGKLFSTSFRKYSGIPARSGKPLKLLLYNNFVTGCTSLFKRDLVSQALPIPSGGKFHDWWMAIVASKIDGIRYIDKPLIYYRQHSYSHTGFPTKSQPLWQNVIRFIITKRLYEKRIFHIKWRKWNYERLIAIANNPIFTNYERELIREAIDYFKSPFHSKIHFKAFVIAMRNGNYIYPRAANTLEKMVYTLTELVF